MTSLTDALRAALATPTSGGFTVAELVAQAGLPLTDHAREKIRRFLSAEIASGRVIAQMGRRRSITGHPVATPIYLPVPGKAKRSS